MDKKSATSLKAVLVGIMIINHENHCAVLQNDTSFD